VLVIVAHAVASRAESPDPMVVELDASDFARRILSSTVTIPLDAQTRTNGGEVPLWYPKWVPGSHAPGGPIGNVAGLIVHDDRGRPLLWRRAPGEIYRFLVTVPSGTRQLHVHLRYITNQPTTNSFGLDSFGSALLGVVSPNTLLVYREGIDIDTQHVQSSLRLPAKWQAATALTARAGDSPSLVPFEPVSLRVFVDSPIMCGRYYKKYDLVHDEDQAIPPHRLHVFSEAESVLNVPDDTLTRLRQMVTRRHGCLVPILLISLTSCWQQRTCSQPTGWSTVVPA
jgi:predicted metalloprotease with PDZ domain